MKKQHYTMLLCSALIGTVLQPSCSDYLEEKPDKRLAVPHTVADFQALMDNEHQFIQNYPPAGDIASDFHYLDAGNWATLVDYDRDTYTWQPAVENANDWIGSYEAIFTANVVLDNIDASVLGQHTQQDKDRVKGTAYFFRGWRYFLLSQLFAVPYRSETAQTDPGLPLRLEADINVRTVRSNLQDTYAQVLGDLRSAARWLPVGTSTPTRPAKPAAYAALARVALVMGGWEEAAGYADSCLAIRDGLLDYNDIDTGASRPFALFNREVLLHTTILSSSGAFMPMYARVDSALYDSYTESDLRKILYFTENPDGSHSFKGSYTGDGDCAWCGNLFSGLALDEVYLTKAEALARLGHGQRATATLHALQASRYDRARWTPEGYADNREVLAAILSERRKSLAFRAGIRWSDLRRLHAEGRDGIHLVRQLDGVNYTLPPNDPRYTFLIPEQVIALSGIAQNGR